MYVTNVAADTIMLTCHYFVSVLLFSYCLCLKSALMTFSKLHYI